MKHLRVTTENLRVLGAAKVTRWCCEGDVLVLWGRMYFCGIRCEKPLTQYALKFITQYAKIAMDKIASVHPRRHHSGKLPTMEVAMMF